MWWYMTLRRCPVCNFCSRGTPPSMIYLLGLVCLSIYWVLWVGTTSQRLFLAPLTPGFEYRVYVIVFGVVGSGVRGWRGEQGLRQRAWVAPPRAPLRCWANMAHERQSSPYSGRDFQVKVFEIFCNSLFARKRSARNSAGRVGAKPLPSEERMTWKILQIFCIKKRSSQGQNLTLTGLVVPYSLDSGQPETLRVDRVPAKREHIESLLKKITWEPRQESGLECLIRSTTAGPLRGWTPSSRGQAASERRGNKFQKLRDVGQVKAKIWPWLPSVCHIRSTAAGPLAGHGGIPFQIARHPILKVTCKHFALHWSHC